MHVVGLRHLQRDERLVEGLAVGELHLESSGTELDQRLGHGGDGGEACCVGRATRWRVGDGKSHRAPGRRTAAASSAGASSVGGSAGSGPTTVASAAWSSVGSLVTKPGESKLGASGTPPVLLIRPSVVFNPYTPQKEAGIRIEPPVSLATASGTMPAATAAAEPPLDPPAMRSRSHGLRVDPRSAFWVVIPQPNSWERVVPTTTAPARRSAATMAASAVARRPASTIDPYVTSVSATSNSSFTPMGTPCRALRG